jgi:hypothetical protein
MSAEDDLDPQLAAMDELLTQVQLHGVESLTLEEAVALRGWIHDVYLRPHGDMAPDYRPVAALVKALLDGMIARREAEHLP